MVANKLSLSGCQFSTDLQIVKWMDGEQSFV